MVTRAQGRTRRQRRADRKQAELAAGRAVTKPGPAPMRSADRWTVAVVRCLLLGLAVSAVLIPVVAPRDAGGRVDDDWLAAGAVCLFFLTVLGSLAVLPIGLTKPRVGPGPVLTVTTVRGRRHVRLDALTRVGAVEPPSRGVSSLYVRLRDSDGRRVIAMFSGYDGAPEAVRQGAAALARRDPGAVSSRARHYLDLPGSPGPARRAAQALATGAVFLVATVAMIAALIGYASLVK